MEAGYALIGLARREKICRGRIRSLRQENQRLRAELREARLEIDKQQRITRVWIDRAISACGPELLMTNDEIRIAGTGGRPSDKRPLRTSRRRDSQTLHDIAFHGGGYGG